MVAQNVVFGILAAVMVLAAWKVVTTQNVVRAVLYLVVVLAGAAAQFVLLSSEFIAIVQILIYAGAVTILILFALMLTRIGGETLTNPTNRQWSVAVIIAVLVGASIVYAATTSRLFMSYKVSTAS